MSDLDIYNTEQDQDQNLKRYRKDNFQVPEDYFEDLEQSALKQTFQSDVFNTPKGYFKDLESSLIEDQSEFAVPVDYFEKLDESLTKSASPTKLITMKRVAFWLSAACVVGAIFIYRNYNSEEECKTFACLLKESDFSEEELIMLYDNHIVEEFLQEDQQIEIESESEEYMDYLIDSEYSIETLLEDE